MANKSNKSTNKTSTTKKTTSTNVKGKKTVSSTKNPVKPKEVVKEIPMKEEKVEINTTNSTKENSFVNAIIKNNRTMLLILICILLIINIIIVVKGHEVKLSDGKEVIVSVDGKEFTAENLFDSLKETYGASVLVNLVDSFIIDEELGDDYDEEARTAAEAQVESIKSQYESSSYNFEDVLSSYGYENEEALISEYITSYKKEIVVKNYLTETITDDEINSYYESEIYGDYNAKHILIKPETNDDMTDEEVTAAENVAYTKALEVIEKLNNGSAWSDLVSEYSEDTGSVDADGLIENFTKGDVVDEFFNSVISLNDGQYSAEPVKSTYGYHIILRVSATEKPALDDVEDEVIDAVVEEKLTNDSTLYDTVWVDIRKSYNLTIEDTILNNKYNLIVSSQ
ncbi:MAG: peptidylprolyl isomerase [Bacilli bacterium]